MQKPQNFLIRIQIIAFLLLGSIIFVGGLWEGLSWGISEWEQRYAQKSLPEDVRLKVDSKNIIFSQAYKDEQGETKIKYAYAAEEIPQEQGEDIKKRTSNSQTFVVTEYEDEAGEPMAELKTTFMATPQFYKEGDKWRQIEYDTTSQEAFFQSGARMYVRKREFIERMAQRIFGVTPTFALTATFYPDPHTETTSVDGYVGYFEDFITPSSGVFADDSATSANISYTASGAGYTYQYVMALFDTSSLPDSSVISAATLSVYVISKSGSTSSINVYSSNPASNTALVGTDYGAIGGTLFATKTYAATTASTYNAFTLNASGISNISLVGVSKFSLVTPDVAHSVNLAMAETSGTTQDPKLDITYTASGGGSGGASIGDWFPF